MFDFIFFASDIAGGNFCLFDVQQHSVSLALRRQSIASLSAGNVGSNNIRSLIMTVSGSRYFFLLI